MFSTFGSLVEGPMSTHIVLGVVSRAARTDPVEGQFYRCDGFRGASRMRKNLRKSHQAEIAQVMLKCDTKLGACQYKEPIKDTLVHTRTDIIHATTLTPHTHTKPLRRLPSVLNVKVKNQTSSGTQRE